MAKLTKEQKEKFSADFFGNSDNAPVEVLYLSPAGEWFTDKSLAINSLPKNKEGARVGKLEEFNRPATETAE